MSLGTKPPASTHYSHHTKNASLKGKGIRIPLGQMALTFHFNPPPTITCHQQTASFSPPTQVLVGENPTSNCPPFKYHWPQSPGKMCQQMPHREHPGLATPDPPALPAFSTLAGEAPRNAFYLPSTCPDMPRKTYQRLFTIKTITPLH